MGLFFNFDKLYESNNEFTPKDEIKGAIIYPEDIDYSTMPKAYCIVGLFKFDESESILSESTFTLKIPMATALLQKEIDDVIAKDPSKLDPKVPSYKITVFDQDGSKETENFTWVFCTLKNNTHIPIRLGSESGVSIEPGYHTTFLRGTTVEDRKIVLGFCSKYRADLINASHSNEAKYCPTHQSYHSVIDPFDYKTHLLRQAICFTMDKTPWRVTPAKDKRLTDEETIVHSLKYGYKYTPRDFKDPKHYDNYVKQVNHYKKLLKRIK